MCTERAGVTICAAIVTYSEKEKVRARAHHNKTTDNRSADAHRRLSDEGENRPYSVGGDRASLRVVSGVARAGRIVGVVGRWGGALRRVRAGSIRGRVGAGRDSNGSLLRATFERSSAYIEEGVFARAPTALPTPTLAKATPKTAPSPKEE